MHLSTILIVDDNPANIKMLGNLLKSNNYNAEFALNGKSAIEWIMKKDFDLILLDVMMPEMDGYQVAAILKNTPEKRDIPIIFLTAKNDDESILKGFESGGVDFLTKPFNHAELLTRVATHIALKKAERTINVQQMESGENLKVIKLINKATTYGNDFNQIFPEGFVFSAWQNIASNNFYKVKEKNDLIIFIASSCIGNNVSAILINMFLLSILNEILLEFNSENAGEIAKAFDSKIQILNTVETKVALTVRFFILDRKTHKLYYSGEPDKFCFVRDEVCAIHDRNYPLDKGVEIKLNDRFYMKFGNESLADNDKVKIQKGFKELVMDLQSTEMDAQLEKVEQYYANYENEHANNNFIIGIQISESIMR